jgi:hypothetical protein
MCIDPIDVGNMPVIIDDRLGAHTGATEKAFVHRAPSDASRSIAGDRAYLSP